MCLINPEKCGVSKICSKNLMGIFSDADGNQFQAQGIISNFPREQVTEHKSVHTISRFFSLASKAESMSKAIHR
jgi:hypothetical protein